MIIIWFTENIRTFGKVGQQKGTKVILFLIRLAKTQEIFLVFNENR